MDGAAAEVMRLTMNLTCDLSSPQACQILKILEAGFRGFTTPRHSSTKANLLAKTSTSPKTPPEAPARDRSTSLHVVPAPIPDTHLGGRSLCSQNGISTIKSDWRPLLLLLSLSLLTLVLLLRLLLPLLLMPDPLAVLEDDECLSSLLLQSRLFLWGCCGPVGPGCDDDNDG